MGDHSFETAAFTLSISGALYLIYSGLFFVIPTVGVGKAIIKLHIKSLLNKTLRPVSARNQEVKTLKCSVKILPRGSYLVVNGEKGIGKTCAINSAFVGNNPIIKLNVIIFSFM